jgi:hypothetical protein
VPGVNNEPYQFAAIDAKSVNTTYSLADAKSWFSTPDAKDSILILQSLSKD